MKKKDKSIIVSAVCGVVLLLLYLGTIFGWLEGFDQVISNTFVRNPFLTQIMKVITFLGEAEVLIGLAVLYILICKNKKTGAIVMLNLGTIALFNHILKFIIKRSRPSLEHLVVADGFSFPSGHSACSMAFYGMLIYLINKKCKNKKARYILTAVFSVLILAIGCSRIYLRVHYPSDVLAGFTFGLLILSLFSKLVNFVDN